MDIKRITSIDEIPDDPEEIVRLGPAIIDLIPEDERRRYKYLRGGSAALHGAALHGNGYLNLPDPMGGDDKSMHFAEGPRAYQYADMVARSYIEGGGYNELHFQGTVADQVRARFGIDDLSEAPSVIFALNSEFNGYYLRKSDKGSCEGVVWDGQVGIDMTDPSSRKLFSRLLGAEAYSLSNF